MFVATHAALGTISRSADGEYSGNHRLSGSNVPQPVHVLFPRLCASAVERASSPMATPSAELSEGSEHTEPQSRRAAEELVSDLKYHALARRRSPHSDEEYDMDQDRPEAQRLNALTEQIIGAAIEVHRILGPGLLESAYEACLCRELSLRGLRFRRQIEVPIEYKGIRLDVGYKLDIIVEESVIVELKTVSALQRIDTAQILSHIKLMKLHVGLLINFHTARLVDGLKRVVNDFPDESALHGLAESTDEI
jgi:GxxExxY protein